VNRDQLAHVLRAAASIAGDGDIVVLGSQSILGTFSDARLPDEATMSVEADLAWRHDPNAAKADLVDGAMGEGSQFHSEWGYYAQGVEVSAAVLPAGWENRVEIFQGDERPRSGSSGTAGRRPRRSPYQWCASRRHPCSPPDR
jgi:hypothetical protein